MKRAICALMAIGTVAAAAPALAQPAWNSGRPGPAAWQPINQRQAQLDRRIDVGVRNGSLTRIEANRLHGEFRAIQRLEMQYRRDGLNMRERADLDRRFDALSQRIRVERHDRADRRFDGPRYR